MSYTLWTRNIILNNGEVTAALLIHPQALLWPNSKVPETSSNKTKFITSEYSLNEAVKGPRRHWNDFIEMFQVPYYE
jgi:hypothetical protein